jgi:hypothetical protein
MPKRVVDLLTCWRGMCGNPQDAAVWKMVLSCHFWCLWRDRNDRCFEDHERPVVELISFFFKTLFHMTAALDLNVLSFYDFFQPSISL